MDVNELIGRLERLAPEERARVLDFIKAMSNDAANGRSVPPPWASVHPEAFYRGAARGARPERPPDSAM